MYKLVLAVSLLAAMALTGCGEKAEKPPPETVAPAPPTAEEIETEVMKAVQPVISGFQSGAALGPEQVEPNMKALQTALGQHRSNPNHPEAFKKIGGTLKDFARQAWREKKVWYVVYFYDALRVVDPASAKDIERLRQEAQLIIDMPKPEVTGFMTDERNGQTTIFLKIYLPQSGTTESATVRVGDELHNLRVVEIIGNNRGVLFEYLVNNEKFPIYSRSARESL